jgi:hypothetical protein
MASYMKNPMFGQDDSYDSGWGYDAGGGSGATSQWVGLGTQLLDVIGRVTAPETYQQTYPGAQYPTTPTYAPPLGTTVQPGSVAAAGSIDSNVLLIGGLGLAALFFFRKK